MSGIEIWSVASSIASVILAIFAVALSVWFFKESVRYAQEGTRAAESISASVKKLETLFERLYADTFSMMRDTYTDMRKHVWPSMEAAERETVQTEESAEDNTVRTAIESLREQLVTSMAEIIKRQTQSEEDIGQIKRGIKAGESAALNEAIENTVEAIETPATVRSKSRSARRLIRMFLIRRSKRNEKDITADEIVDEMRKSYTIDFGDTVDALVSLNKDGLVSYNGILGPDTIIKLPEQP